ncbi:alpha/beta hydrolase [Streptomyces goshikiensis]|nr:MULTISPECIES: alpha/beta hydrolase [Streptomyces]AKL66755.1 hydrolase [Streptomyces sp. Mg1]RPK49766.1 Haloacetate dehalogenase H-1 [Streptomyces sp. ADI91-18]WBY20879.1 alpha/beta hydrolase [Streptomyces goshikiensis]WSR99669.1 alpha/beta hydrolase [Streptomyces goshikiensis]WSX99324.1 alpha/beta hydrolase [Streptomyces goshikiensis]
MRHTLTIDGRTLSYLDFGGTGRPLLALHGGMSEGLAFAGLAETLGGGWRVIAPDQRGHGDSDRAPDYRREGYLADAVALLDHLGLDAPVAVLGYSLGGFNAYHLAAAHPGRVSALVNVDATVEIDPDTAGGLFGFLRGMRYTAATREELLAAAGPAGSPFVEQALRPLPDGGWRLPFHPQDMLDSAEACRGDHWDAWLGSDCPALLVHGAHSQSLRQDTADAMVSRRPGTSYVPVAGDHFLPFTHPGEFHGAVAKFLGGL